MLSGPTEKKNVALMPKRSSVSSKPDTPSRVPRNVSTSIRNPAGELSIRELAEILVAAFEGHPLRDRFPTFAGYREVEGSAYYGKGYQDVLHRKPAVAKAWRLLGWKPETDPRRAVEATLDFFLRDHLREPQEERA